MGLHTLTIALSAFLLFLIQPLVARQLLPLFGGSAAVWTTCLVFFQSLLVVGYACADLLVRKLSRRAQSAAHAALVLSSLAFIPLGVQQWIAPDSASEPVPAILGLLAGGIGLPYMVLSMTAPLLQAWASKTADAAQVYRLYALSNMGSLAALFAFPALIEPRATGASQALGWSLGYGVFAVLALAVAWQARLAAAPPAAEGAPGPVQPGAADDAAPTWRAQGLWLALAALGTTLLLAVTTHLTRNVAPVPFLWVLPLAAYLASFVLCFDGRGWYWPRSHAMGAGIAAVAMFLGLDTPAGWNPLAGSLDTLWVSVPLYVGGLFLLCMFCHGELARRRPAAAHLTRFQLMIGIGGALGGLLVGVLAPMTLTWYWELPAALVIVAVGVVANRSWPVRAVGAVATAGTLLLSVDYARSMREDMIEMHRNFYGSVRVAEAAASPEVKSRRLVNGSITHGMQLMHVDWSATPTLYYVETSGIGRVLRRLEAGAPQTPRHVGVVGLGVGTLAAYGRAGDAYRFYEIDPSVVDIARRQFTFLAESRATIETILGDARLSLAQERDQNFDVLAIDAFAGDAIPVHLLTREAGLVYRRHVRDGGVIAIHVSNRYLDLSGVCRQLADALGWRAWLIQDEPRRNAEAIGSASEWVLLTADTTLLDDLRARGIGRELPAEQALRPWTDEFNSLLPILKVSGPRKLTAEGPR